jgi:hypothetical protein
VSNKTRYSLARIPLRWMVRECFKAQTGILFYCDKLREIGLHPDNLDPQVVDRPAPFLPGDHRIKDRPATPNPIQVRGYLMKKNQPAVVEIVKEDDEPFILEEEEDRRDALSPMYDQLQIKKWWWILEILPTKLGYQGSKGEWVTMWKYVFWLR